MQETQCSCETCVSMCKSRPCWATPQEINKYLDDGLAESLYLDYWVADPMIWIVAPCHTKNNEVAPNWPTGNLQCIFLDENNLCKLHTKYGFEDKPLEARLASCQPTENGNIHEHVAMLWDTPEGEETVKRWKEIRKVD